MNYINKLYKMALLLCVSTVVFAQPSFNQYKEKGLEAMKLQNYYAATSYLSEAQKYNPQDAEVAYLLGKSAYMQHAYGLAQENFSFLVDSLDSDAYPDALMMLGQLSQKEYNYDAAIRYADLYLSIAEGDLPSMTLAAKNLKKSAQWASSQVRSDVDYAKLTKLEETINSAYSEHGALKIGDKLYYTSMKYSLPDDIYTPHRKVSKVLSRDVDFYKELDESGIFNNKNSFSSGTAITSDGSEMFTSICKYVGINDIKCELYKLSIQDDGSFSNPAKLPDGINAANATTTHVAVGDTNDESTTLYFSSDREGGIGGMDIYQVSYNASNNSFGTPKNLREINTAKDDISPFYNSIGNSLSFSSDGREGFGGFDVYKLENGVVTNLGYGINSSYNDIYYSLSDDGKESYLSSNRPGSNYLESSFESCCYDIYTGENCIIDLLALLYDGTTKEALLGGSISLKNLSTDVSEEVKLNESGNDYNYVIDCQSNYEITAQREGYVSKTISISTEEITAAQTTGKLEQKIYLDPAMVQLVINTLEKPSDLKLLGATVALVDLETGTIISEKTNGSTNVFSFTIAPGKSYKIVARKGGFEEEMMIVDVPEKITGELSKDIYLGRELSVATLSDLLPIKLYFDNDSPDSRTLAQTTQKSYSQSFNTYYPRKSVYQRKYTGFFKRNDKSSATKELNKFFENDLRGERERLDLFMDRLNSILLTGKKVNLFLRGYASPLSASAYNTNLGKRRVDCVMNEFERYKGGILMKYINSGQLQLSERSFGETSAPSSISDDPRNPSKSIYSPRAARERRVEIEEIEEVK